MRRTVSNKDTNRTTGAVTGATRVEPLRSETNMGHLVYGNPGRPPGGSDLNDRNVRLACLLDLMSSFLGVGLGWSHLWGLSEDMGELSPNMRLVCKTLLTLLQILR